MGVVKEKFAEKRKLHRLFWAHSPIRSAGLKTIKNPVSGAGFSLKFAGLIKSALRQGSPEPFGKLRRALPKGSGRTDIILLIRWLNIERFIAAEAAPTGSEHIGCL
jgi:hypothetical protein